MRRRHLASALILTAMWAVLSTSSANAQQPSEVGPPVKPAAGRPIDMVIVLDTSGSMENLIDSARGRIWSIVLKLAEAKPTPKLRIGLLTYGTPDNSLEEDGWINKQIDLTGELDDAYTKMMAMSTQGGDEYVGWALHKALRNMDWNEDPNALRLIYIAGNESADQAAQVHNFRDVAREAEGRDVIINALYGGGNAAGVSEAWDKVPSGNGGEYFAIDMAAGTVQIATPFDVELERLNNELNATLIPFGKDGTQKFNDVISNDLGANNLGSTTNSTRIAAKACVLWCNSSWDLVDACATEEFNLDTIAEEDLPEFMRKMTLEQRKTYIAAMKTAREAVHDKIAKVNEQREAYIQHVRSLTEGGAQESLDEAIMASIARQAKAKGFVIEVVQEISTPAETDELTPQADIIFQLSVDRLMGSLPRIQYEAGPFHTFDQEVAEQFAATTQMELSYVVGGESFAKLEDAQAGLRAATLRESGRLLQVQTVERDLEDGSKITEYKVAGQVLPTQQAAELMLEKINADLKDASADSTPDTTTPETAEERCRRIYAAGVKAVAVLFPC